MQKQYLIAVILVSFSLIRCENSEKKLERRTYKDYVVEAKFIDSATIDGIAKYYDKNNNLIGIVSYDSGKKEGNSTDYYPNQILKDSMFFSNNLMNGFLYKFDSTGKLVRKSFNYYGLNVGDQFYQASANLDVYFFLDFNKNVLVRSEYDSFEKTKLVHLDLTPKISTVYNGSDTAYNLLIYFPRPPNLSMIFRLGLTNENHKTKNEVELYSNRLFLDTVVLKPEKGWYPYTSVHVKNLKDSINKIYYYDFKYE